MGLFEDIDAFLKQPALAVVPIQQRVQAFLAGAYGVEWLNAEIAPYKVPGGGIYAAFIQSGDKTMMRLVSEQANGELCQAQSDASDVFDESGAIVFLPFGQETNDAATSAYLDHILPALIEADQIIQRADIAKKKKKTIRQGLVDVSKYLCDNFERLQRPQDK